MADYLADPLWRRGPDGFDEGMIPLDRLPLSAQMKARLRAWAGRYDALMQTGYEWSSDADEATWVTDGRVLRGLVQEQLGPAYDVKYLDEAVTPRGSSIDDG